MKPRFAHVWVVGLLLSVVPASLRAAPSEDPVPTARYLAAFQNKDGGFAAQPGGASSLGSTSSAIRTLKNVGGSIPDVLTCIDYIRSCFDSESGGFAPTPGGTPNVQTTAIGLMAVSEMKIATDAMIEGAVRYFSRNVNNFEEIRIAVAGLEAVKKTSPDFPRWIEVVEKTRKSDGTWGEGPGRYRDTGGAAVALLRMGVKLDKERADAIVALLRSGQHADGAWSKTDGPSDLEATYRIMRYFFMAGESPNLDALRGFIANCRHSDGSYAPQPGGEGSIGGCYYATTVLRWVRLLGGEPGLVETTGFVPLFNGRDLTGWDGDTALWSARDGVLVGASPGLKRNEFLSTERTYGDFMLKLTFRLANGLGNSGVQFRSDQLPPNEMIGYQADIGQNYWGCLYDESRRKRVLQQGSEAAVKSLKKDGWNSYEVRAMGPNIRLMLNGKNSVNYTETDPEIKTDGKIAVQVHAGGPMRIEFKDVYIQPLPRPTSEDLDRPGFHLRTVKTDKGDRAYSVFIPEGYDGTKPFPVAPLPPRLGRAGQGGHPERSGRPRRGDLPASTGLPADRGFPPGREDLGRRLGRRRLRPRRT